MKKTFLLIITLQFAINNLNSQVVGTPYVFQNQLTVITATGRIWQSRNLGAAQIATSATDSEAYGNLYQWGRGTDGHESRSSPIYCYRGTNTSGSTALLWNYNQRASAGDNYGWGVVPTNLTPNKGCNNSGSKSTGIILGVGTFGTPAVYTWIDGNNDGVGDLWQGVTGHNNPCPTGFRIPTSAEWQAEINTWNSASDLYNNPLKLTRGGLRYNENRAQNSVQSGHGEYWSSTISGYRSIGYTTRAEPNAGLSIWFNRHWGLAVRCIKDTGGLTIPTVNTISVTNITDATATSGVNVTSNGGATVTSCGVVWDTNPDPTIALSTSTNDGAGTQNLSFVSNIIGLTTATTYYVRAYATNRFGTAYGAQIIFTTN